MSPHPFEPELDQPVPRRVRLKHGLGAGCGLWFVRLFILPHTLAGIGIVVAAVWKTFLFLAILLSGTDVEGRIVGKNQQKSKKGIRYYVAYAYTVDQQEYGGRVPVDADDYAAMKEGDPVSVRVWEALPAADVWPRLPGQWPILNGLGLWGFALFWNGILSLFLWQAYYLPWFQRHLLRRGQAAGGIVRDVQLRPGKGGLQTTVRYEFAVPAGHRTAGGVLAGKMTAPAPEDAPVKVGDVVTVLYDPRRPRRNLLYRLAAYRVAPTRGSRP